MYDQVQVHQINHSQLWQSWERVPHPALLNLLTAVNHLIVLSYGRPPYEVGLGVTHHTASGVWQIYDGRRNRYSNPNPRRGDDNVASFTLVAFSKLKEQNVPCKLVIMVHATTHDPNKVVDSPYCQEILGNDMKLLFECHASSSRRHLDLELSAGNNHLAQSLRFGQFLASALKYRYSLGVQTLTGHNNALIFSPMAQQPGAGCTRTVSLTEARARGIPVLHLEAKLAFRSAENEPDSVSFDGLILGRAIAETIVQL